MSSFTKEEKALKDAGKCSVTVEYGNGRGIIPCGDTSAPGAQDGDCADHDQDRKDGNR